MKQKEVISGNGKCQAKTKAGNPCRAPAVRNERFCSLHLVPNLARKLGRKGGQKNRSQNLSGILDEPLAIPQNAWDVLQMLRRAFALAYAGQLSSGQATSLAYLASVLLKAQEAVELETKIALLEKQNRELLEKLRVDSTRRLSSDGDSEPAEKEKTVEPPERS